MIGILALQGDFEKHAHILDEIELENTLVRYPEELTELSGLIIPGGESTTLSRLLKCIKFRVALKDFSRSNPILGTCTGLILMAKHVNHPLIEPLGILDVDVERNAYGRQIHSFVDDLKTQLNGHVETIPATFIRAPKIINVGKDVEIIAKYNGDICALRQGMHVALTFHPELNGICLFHKLAFVNEKAENTNGDTYYAT